MDFVHVMVNFTNVDLGYVIDRLDHSFDYHLGPTTSYYLLLTTCYLLPTYLPIYLRTYYLLQRPTYYLVPTTLATTCYLTVVSWAYDGSVRHSP